MNFYKYNLTSNLKNNLIALGSSLLGSIFLIYYIFRASTNVIASDYFRIIYYYLPDVEDLKYLFSWEGISRIPFTFLARIINKDFFHYSVYFDKILGVFGLFLFNFIVVKFILNTLNNNIIKTITVVIVSIMSFSLASWELILNGTGYAHFLTVGFIALVFYLFDRISKRTKTIMTLENLDSSDLKFYGNKEENNRLSNIIALIDTSQMQRKNIRAHIFVYVLVLSTSLLFAGAYSVSFLCTIILFSLIEIYAFIYLRDKYNKGEITPFDTDDELYQEFKEQYNSQEIRPFGKFKGEKYSTVNNESTFKIFFKFLVLIIIAVICLSCYFKSNNTGEPLVPVGAKDVTLMQVLEKDPKFLVRFFLKSLSSAILGVETFQYAINFGSIDDNMIFFVGNIYLFIILFFVALEIIKLFGVKNNKSNIFDINTYTSLFPYMFVIIGLANFVLVFLARYTFVRDEYGMSSRYYIQYMFLNIGLILLFMMFIDKVLFEKKYFKVDKKESKLSKGYLKRKEKLIEQGKLKPVQKSYSFFYIIISSIAGICVFIFLTGHLTTTIDEIFKADYRIVAYKKLEEMALNYENYTDEELMNSFEYHRDINHIKYAFEVLKNENLNVFYDNNKKSNKGE